MTRKMCKLAKEKLQKSDPEKYKSLIQDATHYCKSCGRAACKPSRLCKPEKI
jgi:hypothetical protein